MDVTEVGVALPPLGVSALGVAVTRRLLATFRASGDWIEGAVVLVGSGGNAAGTTTGLEAESGGADTVADALAFAGTEMFKPETARLSAPFAEGCVDGAVPTTADCFLVVAGNAPDLAELIDLTAAGVIGVLPLLVCRAGKSSDCRAGCEACEAIAFERPLLEANCCTSCFACEVGVSAIELGVGRGVAGTETLESGVAARG
jgi:hypothetical protein